MNYKKRVEEFATTATALEQKYNRYSIIEFYCRNSRDYFSLYLLRFGRLSDLI